jgi:hypothetical protein
MVATCVSWHGSKAQGLDFYEMQWEVYSGSGSSTQSWEAAKTDAEGDWGLLTDQNAWTASIDRIRPQTHSAGSQTGSNAWSAILYSSRAKARIDTNGFGTGSTHILYWFGYTEAPTPDSGGNTVWGDNGTGYQEDKWQNMAQTSEGYIPETPWAGVVDQPAWCAQPLGVGTSSHAGFLMSKCFFINVYTNGFTYGR